jgi:hypothetical protein
MGAESFFKVLPLRLIDLDMNSLRFAQESRSYLLQIVVKYLKRGDLVFFIEYFVPQILALDNLRK